jgi:diacylglycerol kinase family enzyme
MKARFIVNPRSGAAARALPHVRSFAAHRGAEVVLTEHTGHASTLAEQALQDGCERVVAVGGDGTLNEVARVLIGTSAVCGLVPCGSGNGLGRHLGIHGSVASALAILDHGRPRTIDTGLADGRPFFTAAGLGFEAELAARFNQPGRRGFSGYLATGAPLLRSYRPQSYRLEHGGQRETLEAFTLAVANSDQYGNQAYIAPGARVDDGLLNLTAVPPLDPWNAVPLLWRLFRGTLADSPGVALRSGARIVVERTAPGLLHVDGETCHAGPRVEFLVRPLSLRILAPVPRPSGL